LTTSLGTAHRSEAACPPAALRRRAP